MARKLVTHIDIWSDLDGAPLPEDSKPVEFSFDGRVYFIDLSDVQTKEVQEFLQPYMDAAHRNLKIASHYKLRKPATPAIPAEPTGDRVNSAPPGDGPYQNALRDRKARAVIKKWANKNGWELGARGRVPVDVILAYQDKHPGAYIPESTLQAMEVTGGE